MHGSPCQDFSAAGKQAGGDKDSNTRSSLMYETIRIVEKLKPKYIVWENVKNLLSKKHKHNFKNYIQALDELGYNSYYKVLNAKDYGIPQNRERVFTVSIRKDIDEGSFLFPEKEELRLKLKDLLENEVDEKYFLSEEQISKLTFVNENELNLNYYNYDEMNRVYSADYISPALRTMQGGNRQPKVFFKAAAVRGRYNENGETEQQLELSNREYANAVTTVQKDSLVAEIGDSIILSYPSTPKNRVYKEMARCVTTGATQGVFVD